MRFGEVPKYEDLKKIKECKHYSLYFPVQGGYFRLTINEDSNNEVGSRNISLDYMQSGYLCYICYNFNSNYKINNLYKFNKKNYQGLIKLYIKILEEMFKSVKEELDKVKKEVLK